jgi:nucleotide-binding universal stress UspA family protein
MTLEGSRILVPIDGSEPAFRALTLAKRIARATHKTLDVVTVLDLYEFAPDDGLYLSDDQLDRIETALTEQTLAIVTGDMSPDDPPLTTRMLKGKGRAAYALLEEAEDPEVAMVVMGRTGKGAIKRLLEGSVSRNLADHCDKPVTLVS